jgi:putative transcriptional regulator
MSKRDVFSELMEGFDALEAERQGKLTLRKHKVEVRPEVEVEPADILALRTRLKVSRGILARHLRVNERTLENWEQGRAHPNAQAKLLLRMAAQYPDTFERLASL